MQPLEWENRFGPSTLFLVHSITPNIPESRSSELPELPESRTPEGSTLTRDFTLNIKLKREKGLVLYHVQIS
jgi:hypothetical protein